MFDTIYESFDQGDHVTPLGGAFGMQGLAYGHPANPDLLYGVFGVSLWRRLSAGAPLELAATFPSGDAWDIAVDPVDFRRAYVAGFTSVFVTPDAGDTYQDITGNLPTFDPGPIQTIEFVPASPHSIVLVGTLRGVFATATNGLGLWERVGSNLPNSLVYELRYSTAHDLLVAGTLGRGALTIRGFLRGGNQPPIARCRDFIVDATSACTANVSVTNINAGTTDPEGQSFNCVLRPPSPFRVGTTPIELVCTDTGGAVGSCTAKVHVGVGDNPACCPPGTNVIVGTGNEDTLIGTPGPDCIVGKGNEDFIDGGDGDDFISAGLGDDQIFGGFGNDLITAGQSADVVDSGPGDDVIGGGSGQDQIVTGDGNDVVHGGENTDTCVAGPGVDVFVSCEH